ncbi:GNAT family N-acetyltransferase [bacterium]|nr:GNAT family N-acetyltransferase [bacterium]
MDSHQELLSIYRQAPSRTLPNAFWKTGVKLNDLRLVTERTEDGELTGLALWQEKQLMALWGRTPNEAPLSESEKADVDFALVHQSCLPTFASRKFSRQEPYFRIIHKAPPPDYNCPPGFHYETAAPGEQASAIAGLIRDCYDDINVDESTVLAWRDTPAFAPDLWIWVLEDATGRPAALGIADLDPTVPEASLEWIQVHPDFRGKGLGKAIVASLLRQVKGRADFTSVSGQVDNRTRPESLYRRCGFTGSDIWWLLAN